MSKLNIAVLPGDGIGPEITEQALNVTKAICAKFGHELTYEHAIWVLVPSMLWVSLIRKRRTICV